VAGATADAEADDEEAAAGAAVAEGVEAELPAPTEDVSKED